MKNKSPISQISTIIAVILIAVAGYYAFYNYIDTPVSQSFGNWTQAGSEVDTAKINLPVTLNLDIYSKSLLGYNGMIKIQVKKDWASASDVVYATKNIEVSIPAGINKKQTVKLTFTPDQATGVLLQEYYYKVYADETPIYDPTTSGDRNGLHVSSDKASGGTVPTVTGILFNEVPQTTVAPGTQIDTIVKMSGTGKGTLKVEIRKDYSIGGVIYYPDSTHTTLTKEIAIDGKEGSTVINAGSWNANKQDNFFQSYFARVYWNGVIIYDPENPTEREYVKLSEGSSGGNSGGGSTTSTGSIILKYVDWNVKPNAYSTATAHLQIQGTWSGAVTIDIRQDISGWEDKNLISNTKTVSGTDKEVTITTAFTAPAGGSWIFIRIKPGIYDSESPDTRKKQYTEIQVPTSGSTIPGPTTTPGSGGTTPAPTPSQDGTLQVLKAGFGNPPQDVITVSKDSAVPVYVYARALNGGVSKTVKVEVRKDKIGTTDDSVITFSSTVQLADGEEKYVYVGAFSPNEKTSWYGVRQYFARVDIGNDGTWDYDPDNPDSRPHVLVN